MPDLGICYFIGGWGWLDICFVLSGTKIMKNGLYKEKKSFFHQNTCGMRKITVLLQRFKQPPEPNSGFSPKAQESERQLPLFSFHNNPLIAFL